MSYAHHKAGRNGRTIESAAPILAVSLAQHFILKSRKSPALSSRHRHAVKAWVSGKPRHAGRLARDTELLTDQVARSASGTGLTNERERLERALRMGT
jgi:hypothetical protein